MRFQTKSFYFMLRSSLFSFFIFLMSPSIAFTQNILHELIRKNEHILGPVFQEANNHEVQIIYTQINRDKNNIPHFDTYTFNLNDNYFYPASMVKMPVAFAALEKINKLKIKGLHKYSSMKHLAGSPPQTEMLVDSSAENNLPSIAHYIKKIFLVSDNDAYNRLYEFVGQAALNQMLYDKGFQRSSIIHRLGNGGASFSFDTNKNTNPLRFYNEEKLLYHQGEVSSEAPRNFKVKNTKKGKAYISAGKLVDKPFDFSKKNYVSLMDLHEMLQVVLFPEAVPAYRRFDLTKDDYQFLYHWMSARPRAAQYPRYDKPDGYVKFFMYEGAAEKIPEHIKIFNKVGFAYGYLTDVAYIIDTEARIEFMLSATIHVNANQIYNDNIYEYKTIGLPFLKKLGDVIYKYEKIRPRDYAPDLGKFLGD